MPKPTKSAPPRLLPNGRPDQSNAVMETPEERARTLSRLAWALGACDRR